MDVSDICFSCKKTSDQMLMLSCIHDLCINCAASSFAQQVHIKKQNPDLFTCQICSQETTLDHSTIAQLGNLAKWYIKLPRTTKPFANQAIAPNTTKNYGYNNTTSPSTKKKQLKQLTHTTPKRITYYCRDHNEQEILYYCFSCEISICPECAIHGKHKDHDVKLMKKSLSQIKNHYTQVINLSSDTQNQLSKYKEKYLKMIKQINDRNTKYKTIIQKQFDTLKIKLIQKQKQIIKNIQQYNKINIQTLTGFLSIINQYYNDINKIKKQIEFILRKDQVQIFQQYSKLSNFINLLEITKKKSDNINGQIIFFNIQSWQQIINNVSQTISNIQQIVMKDQISNLTYQNSRIRLNQR